MGSNIVSIIESRWRLFLWAGVLFVFCYALNTRYNDFPYYYHPDEPGKVEQLMDGKWNFHHPMLMLSSTKLVAKIAGTEFDEQPLVERGRDVSAALMALGVVALSILAFAWRGWPAAIVSGIALATHHQLYELAHYLKEDSALLAGMAVAFLAAYAYWQLASLPRAFALGVACALAISGKYIGAVVMVVAIPAWMFAPKPKFAASPLKRSHAWGIAGLGFLTVMLMVNWPMLSSFETFISSFSREVHLVATGQGEVTRSVPHALYWNVFVDNTSPIIWLLIAAFLAARWEHRHSLTLPERILLIFPFAYALALSFSPKENDRYFLPATAMFTLFAGMGVEDFPRVVAWFSGVFGLPRPEKWLEGRRRTIMIWLSAVLLILVQLTGWWRTKPGWLRYDLAFQKDDQAEMLQWLANEVPPTAIIAADSRVGLPDPKRKKNVERVAAIKQKLLVGKLASDLGTIDELRAKGVTHVAVSETSYGRFFRGDLRAKDSKEKKFQQGRGFYERLFYDGVRVFERERGTVIYLHPGIVVYKIAEPPSEPSSGAAAPPVGPN